MGKNAYIDLLVHATHEAGVKVGGIGAVLDGLLSAHAYTEHVSRTVLVGPMDTQNPEEMERLTSPRNRLEIAYSSYHTIDGLDTSLGNHIRRIEQQHNVRILYGARAFGAARHEVILVDGRYAAPEQVNAFKGQLYDRFGIQSDRYEYNPEFAIYINAALPSFEVLEAVAGDVGPNRWLIAHEFMGLPFCYCAMLNVPGVWHTVFYGHEVTTARPIVEFHSGHDTMFYNVMAQAREQGRYLEDVFGDQSGFFKHALVKPAVEHCDRIFAVGDRVVQEMRFLGDAWARARIDLVYNGVPSVEIALDDKKAAQNKLKQYSENLLAFWPDYVFSHVTRFIPSKGLWRDLRVMEHLDALLAERRQTALFFVLSSVIPMGRSPRAVQAMEAAYGWPVTHRESTIHVDGTDVPDLVAHETPFYHAVEAFNWQARASKIVLVNQFGWSQDRCGLRMPAEMQFMDIRQGTDLEFGQSIYEPFGIAQLEPLSFGALCVVSNVCGCVGFVDRVGGSAMPNVIVADYTDAGVLGQSAEAALSIDQVQRNEIEVQQAGLVARQIVQRLPQDDLAAQKLLVDGYALGQKMSWEVVARDYLLPGLEWIE
ncbi:MAG: hypothetical protein JW934_19775 [Anaerolineae bacterium]|nr:hypothetical protein [Anaerolineae bacterium]